ncbi:MAG: KH domain-containing protein [Elusimicrobiota bacterium]|jgi:predicted RNA-binding protein YlqC (UPF0109 family)|nr:KH domain-containing protein [Elusimicrobiota bacterium]
MQKELLLCIVQALVNNPNNININEVASERLTILELKVEKEDIGRIIGKQGNVIKSIRTLLNASAAKNNKKIALEIIED